MSFTKVEDLLDFLQIDVADTAPFTKATDLFRLRVPRFFAQLMEKGNIRDPLLQQVLPHPDEFIDQPGFVADPLQESSFAQEGLVHKYGNRVLLILKGACAVNCRYCFRRHFPYDEHHLNRRDIKQQLDYIRARPDIDEVILSGGDPLLAKDDALTDLIAQLETIPHLIRLRIHTRLPVVIPQRLTAELMSALANTRLSVALVLHINHPNEVSIHLSQKVALTRRNLINVYNQAVILKGINDSVSVQMQLNQTLYDNHIQPYYVHAFDHVQGASHFAVDDRDAVAIMREVTAQQSGYMVPKLVREVPGKSSKLPLDLGLLPLINHT